MFSDDYKTPSCESGVGNVNADIQAYTFTGAETAGAVIRMRRMSERNVYLRITAIADAGFAALTAVDIGYVSRDGDNADNLVAFAAGLDINTTTNSQLLADVSEIDFAHDIAVTISVPDAASAGLKLKLLVEFINKSG